jgi:hypothetical protein
LEPAEGMKVSPVGDYGKVSVALLDVNKRRRSENIHPWIPRGVFTLCGKDVDFDPTVELDDMTVEVFQNVKLNRLRETDFTLRECNNANSWTWETKKWSR